MAWLFLGKIWGKINYNSFYPQNVPSSRVRDIRLKVCRVADEVGCVLTG